MTLCVVYVWSGQVETLSMTLCVVYVWSGQVETLNMTLCVVYVWSGQVETLNATLSENSAVLAETQKRVSELQTVVAASEHDRRVLQQRLDITRSVMLVTVVVVDSCSRQLWQVSSTAMLSIQDVSAVWTVLRKKKKRKLLNAVDTNISNIYQFIDFSWVYQCQLLTTNVSLLLI